MTDDDFGEAEGLLIGEGLAATRRDVAQRMTRRGFREDLDLLVQQEVERVGVGQTSLLDELRTELPVGRLEDRRQRDEQRLAALAVADRSMREAPHASEPLRPRRRLGQNRGGSLRSRSTTTDLGLQRPHDRGRVVSPLGLADVELAQAAMAVAVEVRAKAATGLP